ncbi:MAG: YraN family protein [Patescibacteria group bacterium]
MNNKKLLGNQGEIAAERWLREKNYQIIEKNIRFGNYEIDLIAKINNIFVFVEIKTGHFLPGDLPLKKKQQKFLKRACVKYCEMNNIKPENSRFDLIIITPIKTFARIEHLINLWG